MKKNKSRNLVLGFLVLFVAAQFYPLAEIVFADHDDFTSPVEDIVIVTLNVQEQITISHPSDVTMSPDLGVVADSSIGSAVWTVKTNAVDGYTLAVKASTSDALRHVDFGTNGHSFADYTESTPGTPEAWSIAGGAKEFGYSAFGTDVVSGYGTAGTCGAAGVPDPDQFYEGFETSDNTIATRATVTPNAGIATTICFAAAQNAVYAPSGTYTATITATATTL